MTTICVLFNLVGLLVFLHGFFPIKHSIPGQAAVYNITEPLWSNSGPRKVERAQGALYDRLVLVLVDALRADFVLPWGSTDLPKMQFVSGLIARNNTLSYMARADVPTVTMPRIKALTTGGIPGFIDVVLNFDSEDLTEDNVISQLHRAGKRIVFYGDDTWMQLFPGHFIRAEGTTSFFVTDYTEVDNNVTRHVAPELERGDWDVLILHYLGLDHIGHLAGPRSPLVQPKVYEMDGIVQQIYESMLAKDKKSGQSTLVMLCGDHGMSDQGSHGGATDSETATPLIFLSSRLTHAAGEAYSGQIVRQIDVASSLSVALGIPIPQNSLGSLIIDVVRGLSPRDQLKSAYNNAQQLRKVLEMNIPDHENEPCMTKLQHVVDAHVSWLQTLDQEPGSRVLDGWSRKILKQYSEAMKAIRNRVSSSLAEYDLHEMVVGIIILWAVVAALVKAFLYSADYLVPVSSLLSITTFLCWTLLMFTHITVCTSASASRTLCSVQGPGLLVPVAIAMFMSGAVVYTARTHRPSTVLADCSMLQVLVLGAVMHTMSLLSSSFVEEEHQTWYFLSVSLITFYTAVSTSVIWVKGQQTGTTSVREHTAGMGSVQKSPGIDMIDQVYKEHLSSDCELRSRTNQISNERKTRAQGIKTSVPSKNAQDIRSLLGSSAAVLVLCRLARSWNRTGDKWAHLPDVGDWLVRPEHKAELSLLVAFAVTSTLCLVCVRTKSLATTSLYTLGVLAIYCFRTANGSLCNIGIYDGNITKGINEARCVYAVIFVLLLRALYAAGRRRGPNADIHRSHTDLSTDIQVIWTLLVLLIMRPHNIVLAAIVFYIEHFLCIVVHSGVKMSVPSTTLIYYWLGQAAFFYQGNSNSIATIDVSAGYIGLSQFHPMAIGLLMCVSTYAFPIYAYLSLLSTLVNRSESSRSCRDLTQCAVTLLLCRAVPVAVYVVMVTAQRYHLFVWSVFSPKLLYEGMHTVVVSLFVLALLLLQRFIH